MNSYFEAELIGDDEAGFKRAINLLRKTNNQLDADLVKLTNKQTKWRFTKRGKKYDRETQQGDQLSFF